MILTQACKLVLVFLAFLVLLPQMVLPYFTNGNQIRDLESTDTSGFTTEVASWTLSSYYTGAQKVCNCGTPLLGGYKILGGTSNEYFEREYTNLPTHNLISFSFKVWIIDTWDLGDNDHFQMYFSGTVLNGPVIESQWFNTPSFSNLCGQTYSELPNVRVSGTVAHSGSTLTFRVISQLNDNSFDESFGFREASFMFMNSTTPTTAFCTNAPISLSTDCPCPDGQYASSTIPLACSGCHGSCNSCFGPTASDCYDCKSPYVWDGSKCIQCHANCNGCSGEGNTKCLACVSNKYTFGTTTCLDTCDSPLKSIGYQCKLPCNTGEFLYWDNSCLPACDPPLQTSSQTSTSSTSIAFPTCNYPCASTEYLYWDGICRSACDLPLSSFQYKVKNFCGFPCTNPATPILYWDGTCSAVCDPPHSDILAYGKQFCSFGEDSAELLDLIQGIGEKVAKFSLLAAGFCLGGNFSSIFTGILSEMIQYLKYMAVFYSDELIFIFKNWDTNFFSFDLGIGMPEPIENDQLIYKPLPMVFTEYDLHPSLLNNFWEDLIDMGIVLACLICFAILEYCTVVPEKSRINTIIKGIRIRFQNTLLTLFYEGYGNIFFYSIIEFRSIEFDSNVSALSFSLCFFLIIIGFIIFFLHFRLLLGYQRLKQTKRKPENKNIMTEFKEKHKGVQVLFAEFEDQTLAQQSFLLIYIFRDILFSTSLANLFDHPKVEGILFILLNVGILVYIVIKRPIRGTDFIQLLICEMMLLAVNCTVTVLAFMGDTSKKVVLSKIIIYIGMTFNFIPIAFLIINLVIALINVYKKAKLRKTELQKTQKTSIASNKSQVAKGVPYLNRREDQRHPNAYVYVRKVGEPSEKSLNISLDNSVNSPFKLNEESFEKTQLSHNLDVNSISIEKPRVGTRKKTRANPQSITEAGKQSRHAHTHTSEARGNFYINNLGFVRKKYSNKTKIK